MKADGQEAPVEKRREHPLFSIFVHVGYSVLILSMLGWMIYIEFVM